MLLKVDSFLEPRSRETSRFAGQIHTAEDNHSNNFHTKTEALVHFWVNFFFQSEMSRKMYFLTIRVLLIFYEAVILIKEQSLFVLT